MSVIAYTKLVATECCACGTPFGLPEGYMNDRRDDGGTFYCPNGHRLNFGETTAQRLKRDLAVVTRQRDEHRARAERERAEAERIARRLIAARGQQTKLRKRVAAGCCPCCRRSFVNLQRHMATQHPTFATPDHEPANA